MKNNSKKSNLILELLSKSLLDLPSPTMISYLWNFGFMLGMMLTLQVTTGILLSMMYFAQTEMSFEVMASIMRDNPMGWLTRMLHANGASLFFIMLYLHLSRGMYFSSPGNKPKVWISGMMIIILSMATAFLGYVLPWGQMSFWGATVITGVLSAVPIVGTELVNWIWGGPSISQPTLTRFFSMHFILPMIIFVMVILHLILLHEKGSSNSMGNLANMDKVKFNTLFTLKDLIPLVVLMVVMMLMVSNTPNIFGDVENFNKANPLIAPLHIQPEWYFLFAYAILRSFPSKLGGVVSLLFSVLIISILIFKKSKTSKFSTIKKTKFWLLVSIITTLTWIGGNPVEPPFEEIGKVYSILYFCIMMSL